jgi:L-xylulokinase
MESYLLGIDNGLTTTKAVIYNLQGTELGIASLPTRPVSTQSGFSEIDMHRQWENCCMAVRQVLEKTTIPAAEIAAIGVSAYGNGLHLLDQEGQPLGKAMTSMDHRALHLVETFPEDRRKYLQALTLQNIWDAQPGMLAHWIKVNQPERYQDIGAIVFCKDWIQYCLTGHISTEYTDISAAGLLNNRTKSYDQTILELLEIPELRSCLPEVIKSSQVAGTVTPEAAEQTGLISGIPVVGGMFDVTANSIGSGLIRQGQFCTIAGTWNINIALGQQPFVPQHIRQCTIYGDDRLYSYIDSSATSASNLEWFLQNVLNKSCSYDQFEHIIAQYQPGDVDIIFLPFVNGGLRNDNPGALFYGLKNYHGRNEMLRAVAEGISFAHYYHIHNLLDEGVKQGDTLFFTGGASKNRHWCQMFADMMQMRVEVPESEQTGALGDCIMAGVGAGVFADFQEAINRMVRIREIYEPNPEYAEVYQKKYERFVELLKRVTG